MSNTTVILRNPHSVIETLKVRPRAVKEILLNQDLSKLSDDWKNVVGLAQKNNVRVATLNRSKDKNSRFDEGRQTLAEAHIEPKSEVSLESLFHNAQEKRGGKGLWIALDCIQDPHNLGAIFRSAAFFGAEGILITQERSSSITGTAYDVSCGGVETVPFHQCVNLRRALDHAKEQGVWTLGTSEHAKLSVEKITADRPRLLILGNEEKGMRRLTAESCDEVCQIPPRGPVTSLNVSVAAGILISRLSLG